MIGYTKSWQCPNREQKLNWQLSQDCKVACPTNELASDVAGTILSSKITGLHVHRALANGTIRSCPSTIVTLWKLWLLLVSRRWGRPRYPTQLSRQGSPEAQIYSTVRCWITLLSLLARKMSTTGRKTPSNHWVIIHSSAIGHKKPAMEWAWATTRAGHKVHLASYLVSWKVVPSLEKQYKC